MHKDDICIAGGFLSLAFENPECGTSRCALVNCGGTKQES